MRKLLPLFSKSAIATAIVISIAACGGNSTSEPLVPNDDPEVPEVPEVPDDSTEIQQPDNTSQAGVFGPPQILTVECGALAVSTETANNSLTNPKQLNVGEPVRGQLVPDSSSNNFHVWQSSVQPGNYHLIVDTSLASEESTNLGITVTSLGATTPDDVRLVSDRENGFDMRAYKFLEIQEATTLKLKLEAVYDSIHNYTMVLIPNGSPVPSPTLEDCLSITTTSVGTTEVATLTDTQKRNDQPWYRIDLADQEYKIDASTNIDSSVNMGYRIVVLEQFGQADLEQTVTNERVNSTNLITSDTFKPESTGSVWLRVENIYRNDLNVELTVNAQ